MAADEFTEQVRAVLTGESPWLAKQRRTFKQIPSPPRCKLCAAPFAGLGGLVLRHAGFRQSSGNPALCTRCVTDLRKRRLTGVEIPITLLFSDMRGSTAMGERMRPADFHTFLDRFYRLASDSIVAHDGIVDKVVGDEVIGLFFGGITGPRHAAAAVAAAIDLAERAVQASTTPGDGHSIRNGCPHRRGIRWRDRAGHHRRGLHRARGCRQHHRPTRIGCGCRRGDRQRSNRRGGRHDDRSTRATHRGNPRSH
jgi:hypothetical protein